MFDWGKFYDEMLGIYAETVMGKKESTKTLITLEYTVPENLADELDAKVRLWLHGKGIELEEEDAS